MNNQLFNRLVEDYIETTRELANAIQAITDSQTKLLAWKRTVAGIEDEIRAYQDAAILTQMGEGGCINGKNAEVRTAQTSAFLRTLRKTDQTYIELCDALATSRRNLDVATTDYDTATNRLSGLRAKASMIAGLAAALER